MGASKQGSCQSQYVMLAAHHLLASSVGLQLPATKHKLPQLKQLMSLTHSLLQAVTGPALHYWVSFDLYFSWLSETMLLGSHQELR